MIRTLILVLLTTGIALTSACSSTSSTVAEASNASGETGEGTAEVAQAGEVGKLDPVKCETITPIGTRIGQRVCLRQSEWDRMRGAGQGLAEETQRRSTHVGNPSGT